MSRVCHTKVPLKASLHKLLLMSVSCLEQMRTQPRQIQQEQTLKLKKSKLLLAKSNLLLRIKRLLLQKLLTEIQQLLLPAPLPSEQGHLAQHCLLSQADVELCQAGYFILNPADVHHHGRYDGDNARNADSNRFSIRIIDITTFFLNLTFSSMLKSYSTTSIKSSSLSPPLSYISTKIKLCRVTTFKI